MDAPGSKPFAGIAGDTMSVAMQVVQNIEVDWYWRDKRISVDHVPDFTRKAEKA